MNKYVLPSAAALLILVIGISSFTPVMAVSRISLVPYLQVTTIPEDDQLRQTGVMLLGLNNDGVAQTPSAEYPTDLMSQHKLVITLNGLLVATSGIVIACNVAEKDKEGLPPDVTSGKDITTGRQFPEENLKTVVQDVGWAFICKPRWKDDGGLSVGVLDVYFVGPRNAAFIADHILVVHVTYTQGRQVFYGTEIQDICVLGHFETTAAAAYSAVTKYYLLGTLKTPTALPEKHYLLTAGDPLGNFAGCEDAALAQRMLAGVFPFATALD